MLVRFDLSISTWGSNNKLDIARCPPATPATCCQRATHHSAAQGRSWGDPEGRDAAHQHAVAHITGGALPLRDVAVLLGSERCSIWMTWKVELSINIHGTLNIHKMLQMIFNSLNIHGTSPPINWIILVQLADHFFRETQIKSCGEERWLACQVFPFFPESWRANLQSLTSHMFSLLR